MIDSKEQYRFVSEEALKRITVKGAPYPKRDQKLVTIGEDEAFLTEALEERSVIRGASGTVSDSVILKVNRSLYATTPSVTSWIDPDKVDAIKVPQDGKVGEVSVATTYEKGAITDKDYERNTQARKHYADTKEKNEEKISDLREALYKSIYGERDEEGEIVVEGEVDKAAKKKEDATNAYMEKAQKLSEDHYNKQTELSEEHENKADEIDQERDAAVAAVYGQIESATDANELAKLNIKLEQVEVEYKTRDAEEDIRYEKAVHDEDESYAHEKRELKKAYDAEVEKIEDDLAEFIEKNTEKTDEAVGALNDEIDEAHVYMMQNGGGGVSVDPFPAMKEYEESVTDAYIRKSCTAKYDARPLAAAMSSTRLNRAFADLEHMRIYVASGLARRPCWIDFGDGVDVTSGETPQNKAFYEEWSRSSSSQGVSCSILSSQWKTGSANVHGRDYGIYIGNRNTEDVIKKIFADVLVCRYETKSEVLKKTPWPRGVWTKNTTYNDDMIVTYTGPIYDEYGWRYTDVEDKELFVTKGTKTGEAPGVFKMDYSTWTGTIVWNQEEYHGDGTWKTTQESYARQWFLKRISLSKKGVTGGIIEKLDEAADKYAEKRQKANDKHDKELAAELEKHEKILAEIQAECDKAVEEAYEQEEKDKAAAHDEFVREAYANAQEINQSIEDAVSDNDKEDLLKEWWQGVYYPAFEKEHEAQGEAEKKREQAISDAYDRKKEAVDAESERYSAANEPINKAWTDELNELSKEYYGYYHAGKYVNGIRDEVYKIRRDKVDVIFDEYDEKLEGESEKWSKTVKEATDELRSNNPYNGKKDPWGIDYDTPLSDNQKQYIAQHIETEEQKQEFYSYLSAETTYYRKYSRADAQYENAKTDLLKARYEALAKITTEENDIRTLWTGPVDPMGDDLLDGPDSVECFVQSVLNVFVETEPRTLTGVDFSKYYEELKEEEEEEKRKG